MGDTTELERNFSPEFCNEVAKLQKRIIDHIEDNRLRKTFLSCTNKTFEPDPLLCTYFVLLVRKLEEEEKITLAAELIKMVHINADKHAEHNVNYSSLYESVVDNLFLYGLEKEVLSTTRCVEVLVMSTDFTMRNKICQKKWKLINEWVPKMDYKGVRKIFRYILESQLRRLPSTLTPDQVSDLKIVEDLMLKILDRNENLLPPILPMSEISRGIPKNAHLFPLLSQKLAQIGLHFRSTADLTFVNGRCFLYPIPQHPAFMPGYTSWEIDAACLHSVFYGYQNQQMLPFRLELNTPQHFILYMILKQPKGKESFTFPSKAGTKSHWDILISVMICEAMAEAESLSEHEPIPRYQWENINNIVHFGILQTLLNPVNFFSVLTGLVKSTNYTRARDEVMWIVLQIVSSFHSNPHFDEALPEIFKLYNVLFPGDVHWRGASDHPALLARFLAPACTWILLEGKEKLPQPSETVLSHIKFITAESEKLDTMNNANLAVLANCFRTGSNVGKWLLEMYMQSLESPQDESPLITLSYNRMMVNRITSFAEEFLDSLTIRARKTLIDQCFECVRKFTPDRLPSPAAFDVMARIAQSMDYDHAGKDVVNIAHRTLKRVATDTSDPAREMAAKDQTFFLFDLLCYRLSTMKIYDRPQYIMHIMNTLDMNPINNRKSSELYELLEQYLIRELCWTSFHENILNTINMFVCDKSQRTMEKVKILQHPMFFANPMDEKRFPFSPEIFRMCVLTFMRSLQIAGYILTQEEAMYSHIITGFHWPEKMVRYFPKWAIDLIMSNRMEPMEPNYNGIQQAVRTAVNLHRSMRPQQYVYSLQSATDDNPPQAILAVIFRFLYDNRDANLLSREEFYEIIDKKSPRDMIIATNFLVDYLIAEAKNNIENHQLINMMAKVLSLMVFKWNIIKADRLLISLVMHPETDEASHIAILIVHEFCLMSEFTDRIKWFNQNVPKKEVAHEEYIRKVAEYHRIYPEREIFEMIEMNAMKQRDMTNRRMPTYYGNLIERLLPIADFVISVTLEQYNFQSFPNNPPILQSLSLLYKYHPAPIQFMYSILYTMYGYIKKPIGRTFVITLQQQIEDVNLTMSFERFNHQQVSKEEIILELLDRISCSLDFILTPPPYISKNWKTAEFSPGAQALYLSCIELMASPHSHESIVPAMINVLLYKPNPRPYNVVNLIALLLNALPEVYAKTLHEEFFSVLTNQYTKDLTFEEIVFDTFEEAQHLHQTNRPMTINVISQAYWSHSNAAVFESFGRKHVPEVLDYVNTENDLWYALRLIVPLMRRGLEWRREKEKTSKTFLQNLDENGIRSVPLFMFRKIIEKVATMSQNGIEFKHEEHLCDLFYNFKYVFAGDFLRGATTEFAKFSPKMRDLMKFFAQQSDSTNVEHNKESLLEPHSNGDEAREELMEEPMQQQPQQQQQQHQQNQNHQPPNSQPPQQIPQMPQMPQQILQHHQPMQQIPPHILAQQHQQQHNMQMGMPMEHMNPMEMHHPPMGHQMMHQQGMPMHQFQYMQSQHAPMQAQQSMMGMGGMAPPPHMMNQMHHQFMMQQQQQQQPQLHHFGMPPG